MRATITLSIMFFAVLTTQSCRNEAPEPTQEVIQAEVVAALDSLVTVLAAEQTGGCRCVYHCACRPT